MYIVYAFMLWVQAFRHQVRRVRAGHSADAGGAQSAGQRLPLAVLRVRDVRKATEHRRRVLPHGGQEAGVQAGL